MSISIWIGKRIKRVVSRVKDQFSPTGFEFNYTFKGDKISIRCPRCRDFVEYIKGAACRCGGTYVEAMGGRLWISFSDLNRPTAYVPPKDTELERG